YFFLFLAEFGARRHIRGIHQRRVFTIGLPPVDRPFRRSRRERRHTRRFDQANRQIRREPPVLRRVLTNQAGHRGFSRRRDTTRGPATHPTSRQDLRELQIPVARRIGIPRAARHIRDRTPTPRRLDQSPPTGITETENF